MQFADPIEMQDRLFAELSRMFGEEVPLYDRCLLVNHACNRAVCDLLGMLHVGFEITDAQLDRTSGERHGAIRIGRDDEYRWVGRFFACFGMEPHNYYDMTSVGAKSQPVIATAFRSTLHPQHRVFTSLLRPDYFDEETRRRIEETLASRAAFTARAKALIEKREREGGLSEADGEALIAEGVEKIFKWTGEALAFDLYEHLCASGFKIAADIVCFKAHHLNHLTPNTFCIDLYSTAMKFCMGEMDEAHFIERARHALGHVLRRGDRDFVRLHFKHLTRAEIAGFEPGVPAPDAIDRLAWGLAERFRGEPFRLSELSHSGFKDLTEGPPAGVPVLLRQDAYKALREAVNFTEKDGRRIASTHTARFGEIEQRFYAVTAAGRALYDECLIAAERDADPELARKDFEAYERAYGRHFARFPRTLGELVDAGLVHARYEATERGVAQRGKIETTDLRELRRLGYVEMEGLRYEDFLPVSAAGIFASNLSQYGTQSTARERRGYTQQELEAILGREIIDADVVYRGLSAASVLESFGALGLLGRMDGAWRAALEADAGRLPAGAAERFAEGSAAAAAGTARGGGGNLRG
ncbi:MAG: VOC family protein [Phycisphaeraceae bacterium]|nr:VOC family protein [Phycisphaerales bacterium]MCB9842085.1 VOC family protein [Phycisphaeraceae bacterium]